MTLRFILILWLALSVKSGIGEQSQVESQRGVGSPVVQLAHLLPPATESARKTPSLFLSEKQRIETVEAFVDLISIKSTSKSEGPIRERLRTMLDALGAVELECTPAGSNSNVPLNLVMEIPAGEGFKDRPGVLLNAHMDTISERAGYAPEETDFDPDTREFFHRKQGSFGADDKAGVTVILSALKAVKSTYWEKGVGHRRVIVIFTAQEEIGCLGARYLAGEFPAIFENLHISLTSDGPINYDRPSFYPDHSVVAVVDEQISQASPYREIMESLQQLCAIKGGKSAQTSNGLGQGDFAHFPARAKAALHFRSPYQNHHRRERVKLDDLFNHTDLFAYILMRMDDPSFRMR